MEKSEMPTQILRITAVLLMMFALTTSLTVRVPLLLSRIEVPRIEHGLSHEDQYQEPDLRGTNDTDVINITRARNLTADAAAPWEHLIPQPRPGYYSEASLGIPKQKRYTATNHIRAPA